MKPEFVMTAIMGVGLVIVVLVLFSRNQKQQLVHRERMVALEKGVAVPSAEPPRPWSPRVYLLRGLIWSFSGVALFICLLGLSAASRRPQSGSDRAFEARRLSDMAGISREEANRIIEKDAAQTTIGMPATIALLGLIPLAVGLAYLVFYQTGEPERSAAAAETRLETPHRMA